MADKTSTMRARYQGHGSNYGRVSGRGRGNLYGIC